MSAGKSTLINALLHKDVIPSNIEACTAKITTIKGQTTDNNIYYSQDQITWNEVTGEQLTNLNENTNYAEITLKANFPGLRNFSNQVTLIDTPGPNNSNDISHKEKLDEFLTTGVAPDILLYVINATQVGTEDDKALLSKLIKVYDGKPTQFMFVLNKADEIDEEMGESLAGIYENMREYLKGIGFRKPLVLPISSLMAKLIRLKQQDLPLTRRERVLTNEERLMTLCQPNLSLSGYSSSVINEKIIESKERAKKNNDLLTEALLNTGIVDLELSLVDMAQALQKQRIIKNNMDLEIVVKSTNPFAKWSLIGSLIGYRFILDKPDYHYDTYFIEKYQFKNQPGLSGFFVKGYNTVGKLIYSKENIPNLDVSELDYDNDLVFLKIEGSFSKLSNHQSFTILNEDPNLEFSDYSFDLEILSYLESSDYSLDSEILPSENLPLVLYVTNLSTFDLPSLDEQNMLKEASVTIKRERDETRNRHIFVVNHAKDVNSDFYLKMFLEGLGVSNPTVYSIETDLEDKYYLVQQKIELMKNELAIAGIDNLETLSLDAGIFSSCLSQTGVPLLKEKIVTYNYQQFEQRPVHREELGRVTDPSSGDRSTAISALTDTLANAPFEALRDPRIKENVERALTSEFEIAVVATMSSGKSTLINALLGRELMPAKNEACTAKISRIKNNPNLSGYSATAYDKNGQEFKAITNASAEDFIVFNDDETIDSIEIEGKIPRISSGKMNLILVDTPGPNNAHYDYYLEHTLRAIMREDGDRPMILYVLNATQLGTNDDEVLLLNEVAKSMKVGGQQSSDRYLFVVNKADEFDPYLGESIEKAVEKVRDYLNQFGITSPNIYPISARLAKIIRKKQQGLELTRTECAVISEDGLALFIEEEELHLNKYAPLTNQIKGQLEQAVESAKETGDLLGEALIYSGVPSLEAGISQYLEKYHDTTETISNAIRLSCLEAPLKAKLNQNILARAELDREIGVIDALVRNEKNKLVIEKKSENSQFLDTISQVDSELTRQLQRLSEIAEEKNKLNLEHSEIETQQLWLTRFLEEVESLRD